MNMLDETPEQAATSEEVRNLIDYFIRTQGRVPSLGDVLLMHEAVASVALSRDEEVGTYALDEAEEESGTVVVTGAGGVFEAKGAVGDGGGEPNLAAAWKRQLYTRDDMNRAWHEGRESRPGSTSPYLPHADSEE